MRSELPSVQFEREVDMYEPLVRFFNKQEVVAFEVPFFGKRIDILFTNNTLLYLYAVETKLRDWRSAFKQAALNQIAIQQSYIAVPKKLAVRLLDRERDLFLRYDVGLISVSDTAKILLPATRNGCFSLRHYRALKRTLNRVNPKKLKKIGVIADVISERCKTMVVLQTRSSKREGTF
jgi:hypothetical protein